MGCSNPHPHGQIWSMSDIPSIPQKELQSLSAYARSGTGTSDQPCLLCEYAAHEAFASQGERIVTKNGHWIALVPYWATWPFEVMCTFVLSFSI